MGLSQSASRWRAGTGLAHLGAAHTRLPRGTTFSFTLNEAASVHLAFTQAASGHMVAGHCRAPSRRNARKRACRRTVTVGTLTLAAPAGADRVRFEGRLSASRKLKPGRYRLVASATAGGLTSVPRSLTFTILAA